MIISLPVSVVRACECGERRDMAHGGRRRLRGRSGLVASDADGDGDGARSTQLKLSV